MKPGLGLIDSMLRNHVSRVPPPRFLIESGPWHKTFLRNFRDLCLPRKEMPPSITIAPGQFWNDVLVKSRLPWRRFAESAVLHGATIVLLGNLAQLELQHAHLTRPVPSHPSEVLTYDASEYLAPLDTGRSPASAPQNGDPVYAPQPIISVPPDSDNHQQTIVTPPVMKLDDEVSLPNIVAWQHPVPRIAAPVTPLRTSELRLPASPAFPIAPPPGVSRSMVDPAPLLSNTVVAPAPDVSGVNSRNVAIPQAAVVAPPPGIQVARLRNLSEINIGAAPVVAPAPELPVGEQHALATQGKTGVGNAAAAVVPPPPNIVGASGAPPDARLIALSIHPSPPTASLEVPNGNRRGKFAAGPNGRSTGLGTPEVQATDVADKQPTEFSSSKNMNGVPPGLFVGPGPNRSGDSSISGSSVNDPPADPPVMAHALVGRPVASVLSPEQESDTERQVFGVRKSYSMTLNVPNLNSAAGSLVMHFSELDVTLSQGDLYAPVVTRAVAPGYPLELMRENVQGTVELIATIRSDGAVSDVRVLNDADDRLQAYARDALLRWQFLPALRNGRPVPLQAVVRIPFKPRAVRGF